jgi:hypothetical protein
MLADDPAPPHRTEAGEAEPERQFSLHVEVQIPLIY